MLIAVKCTSHIRNETRAKNEFWDADAVMHDRPEKPTPRKA